MYLVCTVAILSGPLSRIASGVEPGFVLSRFETAARFCGGQNLETLACEIFPFGTQGEQRNQWMMIRGMLQMETPFPSTGLAQDCRFRKMPQNMGWNRF